MLSSKILIGEFGPIYAQTSSAISLRTVMFCGICEDRWVLGGQAQQPHRKKIATLNHEAFDDPMERSARLIACGQLVPPAYTPVRLGVCAAVELCQPDCQSYLNSPVTSCRKFSAVLGTISANSSAVTVPALMPPIVISGTIAVQ